MPKIKYQSLTLSRKTREVIEAANKIIAEYEAQGYDLTLRQLYYQFVARGLVENSDKVYKALGEAVSSGRLAGLIDWNAINDITRYLRGLPTVDSPHQAVRSAVDRFHLDLWADQPYVVEVWVEKDALLGVVSRACTALRVDFSSCRGYVSQSEMWRAAQRLKSSEADRKKTIILHLGDHDPSGCDMSRDIAERLEMFGSVVDVRRIALNMDQVLKYGPPPNPAKLTDSRASKYIELHGDQSWELDALDPATLTALIEEHVGKLRDQQLWDVAVARETRNKAELQAVSDNWPAVLKLIAKKIPRDDAT